MRTPLILPFILLLGVSDPAGAQTLRIYHIDVDNGDATLFVSPSGRTLLVDSGKNGHGSRIRAVLQQAGVTQIDHFVATHYHEDHYGGIDDLIDAPAIPILNGYDRGDKEFLPNSKLTSVTYSDYDTAIGSRADALTRGETIPLDPTMTVTCISAGGVVLGELNPQHANDENDMSISLLIQFGSFRYFIGGDIETDTEMKIAAGDLVLDVDVYQVNHHGADNGSSQVFLDDLLPTVIVISNGDVASFRHPRQSTLVRMASLTPTPTVFQTNKYLHTGDDGGNVPDAFIANLQTSGAGDPIVMTVDAAAGNYQVTYSSESHIFAVKQRASTAVVIESLLPNPTAGPDRAFEQVTLRNDGTVAVAMAGWLLQDAGGRVWTLVPLGTLNPGQSATIRRNGMPMSLNNNGDIITLLDLTGQSGDTFSYTNSQPGVVIQTNH